MEGISDIRIVSVDSKRPPVLRKEPYIDVFYTLSHKVPKPWCEDFNALLAKQKFTASVRGDGGLYVESWVRTPDDIPASYDLIKKMIKQCNENYIAKIMATRGKKDAENDAQSKELGEQGRLNTIVASLDFSE